MVNVTGPSGRLCTGAGRQPASETTRSWTMVRESELIQSSGVSRPLTDPPAPMSQGGPSSGCVRTCFPALLSWGQLLASHT